MKDHMQDVRAICVAQLLAAIDEYAKDEKARGKVEDAIENLLIVAHVKAIRLAGQAVQMVFRKHEKEEGAADETAPRRRGGRKCTCKKASSTDCAT